MNYFFIPGNPPAIHCYELWASEIRSLDPETRTCVSEYPLLPDSEDSEEAMNLVTETHVKQFRNFIAEAGPPVTIIGHSLGSFFTMKLLERLPEVEKVILTHPFLRPPGPVGRIVLEASRKISFHPRIQEPLLQMKKLLDTYVPQISNITDHELAIALQLARHEARTIALDKTPLDIRSDLRHKITIFYNDKDTWCRPEFISEAKKQVKVMKSPEPHTFITSRLHRKSLFKKICETCFN